MAHTGDEKEQPFRTTTATQTPLCPTTARFTQQMRYDQASKPAVAGAERPARCADIDTMLQTAVVVDARIGSVSCCGGRVGLREPQPRLSCGCVIRLVPPHVCVQTLQIQ